MEINESKKITWGKFLTPKKKVKVLPEDRSIILKIIINRIFFQKNITDITLMTY